MTARSTLIDVDGCTLLRSTDLAWHIEHGNGKCWLPKSQCQLDPEDAGRNMLVSVRGCVVNEIMGALETTFEPEIIERLANRKRHRRKIKRAYSKIRERT